MSNQFDSVLLDGGINKMAEITGISRARIVRGIKKDQFPFIKKVGSHYVVFTAGFEKWMESSGDLDE